VLNILYANAGGLEAALADLPTISSSPFQVVKDSSVQGSDALPFADAAQKLHLKVVLDVVNLQNWNGGPSLLDQLDAHPATYGFYIAEEPTERAPVQAVASLLGTRLHPRIGTIFDFSASNMQSMLSPLLGLADIISCACYPVGIALGDGSALPLASVGDVALAMTAAGARHNFVPAITVQAFSWDQDPTLAPTPDFARWPTRSEMGTMRELAVGSWVSTLLWWTRWAVTRAYDPAARWADVCAAAARR
jgi:hypothetical protein